MQERMVVYHVGDEVTEFPTSHRAILQRLEERLLRRATVVFAAAEQLARAKRPFNLRSHSILNAIDTSIFTQELSPKETAEIDLIPSPRAGFIGVLDTWVDLPLLVQLARELRHVSILIVGVSRVDDELLRSLPNVYGLGRRDRRSIPGILRRLSVSLVPFKRTRLTERIVPLKIFEALAAGVLPVCTDFSPDLESLKREGKILVGRSGAEFVELVRTAMATDTPERRAALMTFGMQQTWTARWREMDAILRSAAD